MTLSCPCYIIMNIIRIATPTDLPAIVAIYHQAINARNATAGTSPFTVEARLDRFNSHSADEYPILVYEEDNGKRIGWFSLSLATGGMFLQRQN